MIVAFFFDWLRADRNPNFTPDGKPWLDQDKDFWDCLWFVNDLFLWAEYRVEHPVRVPVQRAETMESV